MNIKTNINNEYENEHFFNIRKMNQFSWAYE